ncbi:hypothetical protein ACU4GI_43340 [Cupriavidus basilensis]
METLNHSLFLLINAPDHPGAPAVAAATFFAEYAIWNGWPKSGSPDCALHPCDEAINPGKRHEQIGYAIPG